MNNLVARGSGPGTPLRYSRAEQLVSAQRSIGRFGQTIGERPADVDPKLPVRTSHRRILAGTQAAKAVAEFARIRMLRDLIRIFANSATAKR
jgi:hypothetical protein